MQGAQNMQDAVKDMVAAVHLPWMLDGEVDNVSALSWAAISGGPQSCAGYWAHCASPEPTFDNKAWTFTRGRRCTDPPALMWFRCVCSFGSHCKIYHGSPHGEELP